MSTPNSQTVDHAIFSSITQSRIVHLPWSQDAEDELLAQCDDSAETEGAYEFWGSAESDDPAAPGSRDWRVHLDR